MKRVLSGAKQDAADLAEICAWLDKIESKLRAIQSLPMRTGAAVGSMTGAGSGSVAGNAPTLPNGAQSLSDAILLKGRSDLASVYSNSGNNNALIGFFNQNLMQHAGSQFANFAAGGVSSYFSLQTSAIMNGRPDPLGNARMGGSLLGGLIGGGLGLLTGNPYAIGAGISMGSQVGGSAFENLFAPGIKAERRIADVMPLAGLRAATGGYGGSNVYIDGYGHVGTTSKARIAFGLGPSVELDGVRVPRGTAGPVSDLLAYANRMSNRIIDFAGGKTELAPTADEVLKSAGSFSEALIAGGKKPFDMAGNEPGYVAPYMPEAYRILHDTANKIRAINPRGMFRGINADLVEGAALSWLKPVRHRGEAESVLGRYQRRAYERFLKAGSDVLKDIEPIVASEPETGGNYADILGKFGATKTFRYAQLQVEKNDPDPISLEQLMQVSVAMRSATRAGALGGLQPRGSGAAVATAMHGRAAAIATLPGGKDSLEYAQTMAQWRSADSEAFGQKRITEFGIPRARLQGEIDRLDAMPFSPGNRMGLELTMIGKEKAELKSVVSFRKRRAAMGQLSEAEEYDLVQQEEGLKTDMAARLGRLAFGQENKMAAFSAGRPSFFGRYNSLNMAALAVKGTPVMDFGAADGKQAHDQEAWFRQMSGGNVSSTPFSRTADINGHGAEIAGLLRELVSLARNKGGGSSGMRPSEATGHAAANIADKTLNQRKLWNSAN